MWEVPSPRTTFTVQFEVTAPTEQKASVPASSQLAKPMPQVVVTLSKPQGEKKEKDELPQVGGGVPPLVQAPSAIRVANHLTT